MNDISLQRFQVGSYEATLATLIKSNVKDSENLNKEELATAAAYAELQKRIILLQGLKQYNRELKKPRVIIYNSLNDYCVSGVLATLFVSLFVAILGVPVSLFVGFIGVFLLIPSILTSLTMAAYVIYYCYEGVLEIKKGSEFCEKVYEHMTGTSGTKLIRLYELDEKIIPVIMKYHPEILVRARQEVKGFKDLQTNRDKENFRKLYFDLTGDKEKTDKIVDFLFKDDCVR